MMSKMRILNIIPSSVLLLVALFPYQSIANSPAHPLYKKKVILNTFYGNYTVTSNKHVCNLTLYNIKFEGGYYFHSNCSFLKKYDYWDFTEDSIYFKNNPSYNLSFHYDKNFSKYPFKSHEVIYKGIDLYFTNRKIGEYILSHKTDLTFLQKLYSLERTYSIKKLYGKFKS